MAVVRRNVPARIPAEIADFTHKMAMHSMCLVPSVHWMHPVSPVPVFPGLQEQEEILGKQKDENQPYASLHIHT